MSETIFAEGGCSCGRVRYRLTAAPMFVQACHCTWCQRQSGGAFAVNAMIETDRVELLEGETEAAPVPTPSGKGQTILRCPSCRIALWSHYAAAGDRLAFVRVGALDGGAILEPDIHIYTSTRQPWVALPEGAPAASEYYDARTTWPAESLARMKRLMGRG